MLRYVTILIACLVFAPSVLAQPPVATTLDSYAWDYTDAQIVAGAVVRFELCLDAQPCVSKTPAEAKHASGPNVYAYKFPPMLSGPHTISVKACNVDTCSAPLALAFQFQIVPDPATNGRLIKGGA
jgi:hypothetical protein